MSAAINWFMNEVGSWLPVLYGADTNGSALNLNSPSHNNSFMGNIIMLNTRINLHGEALFSGLSIISSAKLASDYWFKILSL